MQNNSNQVASINCANMVKTLYIYTHATSTINVQPPSLAESPMWQERSHGTRRQPQFQSQAPQRLIRCEGSPNLAIYFL